jgi:hypothetical protein
VEHAGSLSKITTRCLTPSISVLIAGRRSLVRVIDHLLEARCGIEVVGRVEDGSLLARHAGRLAPTVIVAHPRVLGKEPATRIASVRRSSPGSKFVLISPFVGLAPGLRRCGADALLDEEALVTRLLPTLQELVLRRDRGRSSV